MPGKTSDTIKYLPDILKIHQTKGNKSMVKVNKSIGNPLWESVIYVFFQLFYNLSGLKVAVTDMRYFAMSKFSKSLVHKKNFSVIWQVVFMSGYVFCQER